MLTGSIRKDIEYQLRHGNMAVKLIAANVVVFLVLGLLSLVAWMLQSTDWGAWLTLELSLPASLTSLLHQPWSVLSYMFLHNGIFHLLFNMLWLYWFSEVFINFLSDKKILPLYLLGGLAGGALYLLAYNLLPVLRTQLPFAILIGASGSVLAVVFAAATLAPDYEMRLLFFGSVRIKYIAGIGLLLDVLSIPRGNAGGYIAHVGGAFFGYCFIQLLRSGTDLSAPFGKLTQLFRPETKLRVSHRQQAAPRETEDEARMNALLDKISRSGYRSLSQAEKDFLNSYSMRK